MVEQETENRNEEENGGQEKNKATSSEEDATTLAKGKVIGLIEILDIKYAVLEEPETMSFPMVSVTSRIRQESGEMGTVSLHVITVADMEPFL